MSVGLDRVAILLATYNGRTYIEEQVNSICWQTHPQWHLFVRDDGSKDGTVEFVRTLVPGQNLTIIDPASDVGGSPSRNFFAILRAVNLNEFDYVAFCDQDDIWAPRKLAHAIECIRKSGAGGYSCNMIPFDNGSQNAWFLNKSFPEQNLDYLFQGASAGCTYVLNRTCAELLQRNIKRICDDPPTGFSHDWTIYALCRSFGQKWHHDKEAHIFYRQHGLNSFGALPSYKGLLARLRLARSGWYRNNILWLGDLLHGHEEERAVLERVRRFSLADRWWLARHCYSFRRRRRDAIFIGIIALCGLI